MSSLNESLRLVIAEKSIRYRSLLRSAALQSIASLAVVVLCAMLSSAQSVSFSKTDYSVGAPGSSVPLSVAVADIDRDGVLDIVTINDGGFFTVLIGLPAGGGFSVGSPQALDHDAYAVAIADFNHDGKADLIITNPVANSVSLKLGDGLGHFGSAQDFATGLQPHGIVVADFNRDGYLDLAIANSGSNSISILLGNGSGFSSKIDIPVGSQPEALAVGDFNRDGINDLVVANYASDTVSVLLGVGDGTFFQESELKTGGNPHSVAVGDFNRDGLLDVVSADRYSGIVSVFTGHGDGTFEAARPFGSGSQPVSVLVRDFNGDGFLDIATANQTENDLSVFLGDGRGNFVRPVKVPTQDLPAAIAVSDFDRDGKSDLVSANSSSGNPSVSVLLNTTAMVAVGQSFTFAHFPADHAPVAVKVDDLNRDGIPDIVTANLSNGTISVLLGLTAGGFGPHHDYPACCFTQWLTLGDFNGDGITDFAAPLQAPGVNYDVQVSLGDGSGGFVPTPSPYPVGTGPRYSIAEDFNRDGKLDVATANFNANTVSVLLGNGDGSLGPQSQYPVMSGPLETASGDFNRDGFPDLAVIGGSTVSILLNNRDGTFATQTSLAALDPISVVVGDFNGDGNPDIVTANKSRKFSVFLGKGDGTFIPRVDFPMGLSNPNRLVSCDVNSDAKLDLILGLGLTGGGFAIYDGKGDGTFTAPQMIQTGNSVTSVTCADINRDGALDVLLGDADFVDVLTNVIPNRPPISDPGYDQVVNLGATVTLDGSGSFDPDGNSITYAWSQKSGPQVTLTQNGALATFVPTVGGGYVFALAVTDSFGASSVAQMMVTAEGAPKVTLKPTSLSFGKQLVGTTGNAKTIKLTNSGTGPLTISNIVAIGNFSQANNCLGGIAVGGSCTVSVTFMPTVLGGVSGAVSVYDDAPDSPQVASLSGTGISAVAVSPASLSFGTVNVGTTTAAKTVTVTNNRAASVSLSFTASSDYGASPGAPNGCAATLAGNANCAIAVTFSPTQSGAINGSLAVSGGGFVTQIVALTGNGSGGPTATLSFSPAAVSITNQVIGTTSAPKAVTVTNIGTGAVTIGSLTASAEFTASGSGTTPCGGTLGAKAKCTFSVTFTPSVLGSIKGSVTIANNSPINPILYPLSGSGVLPVSFSPASLTFAAQAVGTTSAPKTVTLTNNQTVLLNIKAITASGDYAASPGGTTPCGATVAPKGTCTFQVTFTPTVSGTIKGVVGIAHDAPGSPQVVGLSGTGQ